MKIVTYNVMIGGVFEGDWKPTPGRLSDVMKVIRELDPDVLGLQETLSWKKRKGVERCAVSELRKMYDHELIFDDDIDKEPFKTCGTGCALFSKDNPDSAGIIIRGKTRAVEMTFGDLSISCVYLSHEDENKRLKQIKPVLCELGNGKSDRHIIMGDFNAISHKDIDSYTEDEIKKLKGDPKTLVKYFVHIDEQTNEVTCEDKPSTETIQVVYDKGYEDAALKICEKRKDRNKEDLRDKTAYYVNDSVPIRMDYFFVTKNLDDYISDCVPVKADFVQKASDHFPWELNLDDSLFE